MARMLPCTDPVVRISHKELLTIAEYLKTQKDSDDKEGNLIIENDGEQRSKSLRRDPKKREVQIYRPGMGLQHKFGVSSKKDIPVVGEATRFVTHDMSSSPETVTSVDRSQGTSNSISDGEEITASASFLSEQENASLKKNRPRRPDIKVYIPKARAAALKENGCPENDLHGRMSKSPPDGVCKSESGASDFVREINTPSSSKRYSRTAHRARKSSESASDSSRLIETSERTSKTATESSTKQFKNSKSDKFVQSSSNAKVQPESKVKRGASENETRKETPYSPKRNNHSGRKGVCEVSPSLHIANSKGNGIDHSDHEALEFAKSSPGRHKRRNNHKFRDKSGTKNLASLSTHPSASLVIDEVEDWDADLLAPDAVHLTRKALSQEELNSGLHDKKSINSNQSIKEHGDKSNKQNAIRDEGSSLKTKKKSSSEESSEQNFEEPHQEPFSPVIKDWSIEVEESPGKSCFDFSETKVKSSKEKTEVSSSSLHSERIKNQKNEETEKPEMSKGNANDSKPRKRETKSDKKSNRDKPDFEKNLPPRLQKLNKNFRQEDYGSSPESDKLESKVGGIIRLPSRSVIKEAVVPPNEPPAIPPSFPTPHAFPPETVPVMPVVGVSKQLFDPSNPEKPLVIVKPQLHIPATLGQPVSGTFRNPLPAAMPLGSPIQEAFRMMNQSFSGLHIQPPHFPIPTTSGIPSHPISPGAYPFSDQPQFDNRGRRLKPLVEKNLNKAALLERELASYLIKGLQNVDTKTVEQCRWKLQLRYENVILADPRYCAERNVEQQLWKSAFYQFIELMRRQMEESTQNQEEHRQALIKLVDEATVFFENLLEKLQETLGFSIDKYSNPENERPPAPDAVRLALISTQKIFIYLGDLARYREQANGNTNFGKARSWYLKAQQIAPKNGRPYNQLALLAVYGRRKLDAVYYYMRSLAASNPFLSARENLLSLFDEARKKYEHVEKKRQDDRKARREEMEKLKSAELFEDRFEVWIRPDGSSSKQSAHKTEEEEEEDQLNQMSTIDLNKRFVLSFLHVHGKLFTKVGMETFTETVNQMLKEFRALLHRTPAPVGSTRLLQLLAINMFAVANTSLKDQSLDPQCRSLLQEQALQVILAMISIILERATVLLREHFASSDYPKNIVSSDLMELMPAIKVWTDWMSCQKHLWVPPPPSTDFKTGCRGDVWELLAGLLTVIRDVDVNTVELASERHEGFETVTLPEDNTLAGFVPLLGAPQDVYYAEPPVDKDRARHCLRISRIQFFGDYLCGIHTPYLEFDVEKRKFVSVVTPRSEENTESTQDPLMESSDDDANLEDPLQDDDEDDECSTGGEDSVDGCERNEIQRLWCRKEALRKAKAKQDKHRAQIHAVLQEHRHKRPTVLVVQPRYLIPDTNCFIDHLDQLRSLVASAQFNLIVPLIVINELDGLARGSRESPYHSAEHARKVANVAKEAVLFLEERFAVRDPRLRAITSKGSLLDTISFRSEDVRDNKGTNDDLILSCCLHYCQDRAENFMPKDIDSPVQLSREAVLLTEDRNLRVKAMSHNVPVRDLAAFLRWANIR